MAASIADDYMDNSMDMAEEDSFQCKACGEILEEGKAYELAGSRWHINCFRCNTCDTQLGDDANLLLLGDGSLICNNCTYSCTACGSKIEDLAILTGDQAFCASCFRCRNCKRKIDNLRYARTSQGIFCMDCHESVMARRRKKSRAQQQQRREKESPMSTDKSLPALPPDVIPRSAFDPAPTLEGPTELSPRPRQQAGSNQHPNPPKTESSSRSSSRPPRSPERGHDSPAPRDGPTLQPTTYRKNRTSVPYPGTQGGQGSQSGETHGGASGTDRDSFLVPVALDPTPPTVSTTQRSADSSSELAKKAKDHHHDYFSQSKTDRGDKKSESQVTTPHIAFQAQQGRQSSSEHDTPPTAKPTRRSSKSSSSRNDPLRSHPPEEHAQKPVSTTTGVGAGAGAGATTRAATETGTSTVAPQAAQDFQPQEAPRNKTTSGKENISVRTSIGPLRRERDAIVTPDRPTGLRNLATDDEPLESRRFDTGPQAIQRKEAPPGGSTPRTGSSSNTTVAATVASNNSTLTLRHVPHQSPTISTKDSVTGTPVRPTTSEDNSVMSAYLGFGRPPMGQKFSDTYMQPRAPPAPPVQANAPRKGSASSANEQQSPKHSPKLPRWSAGGDFTMEEDLARILGPDESSSSALRRISTAARHGRTYSAESHNQSRSGSHTRSISETAQGGGASPRWFKPPLVGDQANSPLRHLNSPVILSPTDDPAVLKRQLRTSEQRVAELERKFSTESDLKNLNKTLMEKRKTVSALDTQAEVMIRQLETVTGVLERAKASKTPIDVRELEDTAVKELWHKLEKVKITFMASLEQALEEREAAMEDKERIVAQRDRALVEFEQLSMKNAQLADMNNDLTHQIQERFKLQASAPDGKPSGLGIYSHTKNGSNANLDLASLAPSGSTLAPEGDDTVVESGPTLVQVRRVQGKKFNWKKGKTVAQNVAKGVNRAVVAFQQQDREKAPYGGLTSDNIGLPYSMTATQIDAPSGYNLQGPVYGPQLQQQQLQQQQQQHQNQHQQQAPQYQHHQPQLQPPQQQRGHHQDQAGGKGFAFFNRNKIQVPKSMPTTNAASPTVADAATTLFGSDLTERVDHERRQIPNVVSRCIEEVELRGMDVEGIYRKTGGNSQVKAIQDGFNQSPDFDISDPDIDITAVTSVLKQYFRKLPVPLLTFDVYERVLESNAITNEAERCAHLKKTFASMPQSHADCLEFLMFHLGRVAQREPENLMSPKNLAVVFAPTIMRDTSLEREMTDMHAKNIAVQFIIENIAVIFAD